MIKTLLRNGLLKESFHLKSNDYYIDEMAYPTSFNMGEFKSIKSYKGKLDYAKQHLLGKLGAGSSRAVFKVDDEKVLKIALNEKGLGCMALLSSLAVLLSKQKTINQTASELCPCHPLRCLDAFISRPISEY